MSLLREIEAFLRRNRMPGTKFGRLAVNDPRIVGDLREGRRVRPGMEARLREFMENYVETVHG